MLPLLVASLVLLSSVFQVQASQVAAAWYAGYHAAYYPVSSISWDKYNTMYYSFA